MSKRCNLSFINVYGLGSWPHTPRTKIIFIQTSFDHTRHRIYFYLDSYLRTMMADYSSSKNVPILRNYYEGGLSTSSSTIPNAYDENEHQIISNGLGLRVKEVEQKSGSKKEPTAMDHCRSTSSMEKQVCEESAVVEEKENRSGASRMEDKQSLYAFTFDGTDDIHELEWKKEEADRERRLRGLLIKLSNANLR